MLEHVGANGKTLPEQLAAVAAERFPLSRQLLFSDGPSVVPQPLPLFVSLIASILESIDRPCCLVLPTHEGIAVATSTLLALTQLQRESADLLRAHAATSFHDRELVLVNPSNLVYEYRGFFEPNFFKLKVLDKNESRSLPVHEVARLEKTARKRPKGYLNSDLGTPQPTLLGSLVGIPGDVNRNILRTYVVVLGSKKGFRAQVETWIASAVGHERSLMGLLEREVPFGEITPQGSIEVFDSYVAAGEPLVAFVSHPEHLAMFCSLRPVRSTSIIIDDIEKLAGSLHVYDALADRQRLLVLADESQIKEVVELQKRGCDVWQFSPDEILLNGDPTGYSGLLRSLLVRAAHRQNLVISALPCTNEILDDAAAALSHAARSVPQDNENEAVRELFFALYAALLSCAGHVGSGSDALAEFVDARLKKAGELLRLAKVWLTPPIIEEVEGVIGTIDAAVSALNVQVSPKGKALLDLLAADGHAGRPVAVVTRSEGRRDELANWLQTHGSKVPVYRVNELPIDQDFDELMLVAWPSARRFDRLVRSYSSEKLTVLAYAFERMWLKDYQHAYVRSNLPRLTQARKRSLVGFGTPGHEHDADPTTETIEVLNPFDLPEERFLLRRKSSNAELITDESKDDQVDAYYVDFTGPTFAYITEGHELPLVNEFITDQAKAPGSVPYKSIEDLVPGDYVLFRESGDTDIIRFIAEDMVGAEAYRRLRATATLWRSALRSLGSDPRAVWEKLRLFGFSKKPLTVSNWLGKERMIGPKSLDDLRLIARAAETTQLTADLPEIEHAIDEIKSYHIRAGFKLTSLLLKELPKHVEVLAEGETELDLGFGKVWIVRVEEIDETPSRCGRQVANRLLWDEASSSKGQA